MTASSIAKTWGANLKEQREARRWSQQAVADSLDVAFQTVSKWERGEMLPKPLDQARLAGLFGMSVPMLFPIQPIQPIAPPVGPEVAA